MTKEELNEKLLLELSYDQFALINFNIYHNPKYTDYYVDYQLGEYRKCYNFIKDNIKILDIKYTPKKWLSIATNTINMNKKSEPILNKEKIGRNDSCFCGSGKKYKKCCMIKNK